jgi:HNH endonuclease
MAITTRTRRILWIKAGGRCSICHEQLATDATDEDDPSIFGEECHIVARSPGGPRAANVPDKDSYDNLILLCRKHHKQVDDQRSHFTAERLKEIKRAHEEREADRDNNGPVRVINDPTKPTPRVLKLCLTGEDLWQSVNGAHSFYPSWPSGLNNDQAKAVASLMDDLKDWIDVASELSYREGLQAATALGEHIKELASLSLFVGTRTRHLLLTGGVSAEPSSWRAFDIQIQTITEAQLANVDGTPFASSNGAPSR